MLACVGPYRLYGEPVVRACVEAGTDYLDVSGEQHPAEICPVQAFLSLVLPVGEPGVHRTAASDPPLIVRWTS